MSFLKFLCTICDYWYYATLCFHCAIHVLSVIYKSSGSDAVIFLSFAFTTVYTVSKKTVQTYFLSELCQISTDCENFWHRDSKENKLF